MCKQNLCPSIIKAWDDSIQPHKIKVKKMVEKVQNTFTREFLIRVEDIIIKVYLLVIKGISHLDWIR